MRLAQPDLLTPTPPGDMVGHMSTQTLTYAEAADRLSVSKRTILRMIADGLLTPVEVPRPSRRGTVPRLRVVDVDALRRAS